MRTRWAWAGVLALALTGSAGAQDFSSGLTGIRPSQIQFKQVDTTGVMRSPLSSMSNTGPSRFSLTGLFRRLTTPSTRPIMGRSIIPAPDFTNAVSPLPPINSTVERRR